MGVTYTDNMALTLPNPANANNPEAGPLWATDLNTSLTVVDSHNHTTGSGVPVPSAGLRINADLPFTYNGTHYGPTSAAYYGFYAQTAPEIGTQSASLYVDDTGALYYRSNSGVDIQISSDTNLASTGTGAYNGFYGDYAGLGAANAVAIYESGNSSFEFYAPLGSGSSVPTDYNQLTPVLARNFVSYNEAAGTFALTNFDAALTSFAGGPVGGWALMNPNAPGKGFAFGLDSTTGVAGGADGTYANVVLGVYNSTAYASPGTWGFSVNRPETAGTFKGRAANPLDIWLYGVATATPQVLSTLTALTSGTPGTDFGNRQAFLAGGAAWAGYGNALPTVYAQGAVDSFFKTATTANGAGLRLRGAYGGTLSSTPAIEIANVANTGDTIGLGGAAVNNGALVTTYGIITPNTDNAVDLGLSGARFRTIYATEVESSGAITLTGSAVFLAGPVTATSTIAATGSVSGTTMVPSANIAGGVAGLGANNCVRAWARIPLAGGAATAGYNVGATTVTTPSGNLRKFAIPLSASVLSSDAILATVETGDTVNTAKVCGTLLTSSTTAEVLIDTGGGSVVGIHVLVVGF